MREEDIVCGYGGDELLIASFNSDVGDSSIFSNRLLTSIRELGSLAGLTASIGVTTFTYKSEVSEQLGSNVYSRLIN